MITKRETSILKAISIISIVICHFHGWVYQPSEIVSRISGSMSQSGVALFLFLSGYGIYKSCEKSGLEHYWRKRLCKIYIPFLIVVIPQFIIEIWHYRNNIEDMYITSTVLSALGLFPDNLLDGTLWFIPFILFEYVVYYCIRKLSNSINYIYILIGGILSYALLKWKFDWVREGDIYGIAFWIGVLYSKNEKSRDTIKMNLWILLASSILYVVSLPKYELAAFRAVNGLSLSSVMIVGVHLLVTYETKGVALRKLGNIMEIIGNISYELFLTEGIFFWNKILYDLVGYDYRGLLLHMGVIMVFAVMIRKFSYIANMLIVQNIIKT